jgi:hypothetical protein
MPFNPFDRGLTVGGPQVGGGPGQLTPFQGEFGAAGGDPAGQAALQQIALEKLNALEQAGAGPGQGRIDMLKEGRAAPGPAGRPAGFDPSMLPGAPPSRADLLEAIEAARAGGDGGGLGSPGLGMPEGALTGETDQERMRRELEDEMRNPGSSRRPR